MDALSVLFLNPLGEADWGGVETWMRSLAGGLAERGHRVAACARRGSRFLDRFAAAGFPTESLAFRRDFGPLDIVRLRRILRRREVDAVVTKLDRGIRAAGLAGALGGRSAVVQRQGLFEVRDGFRHRFAYRFVDRIITPARCLRERIVSAGVLPADRVDHVPNGVDAERHRRDGERGRALRDKLGLGPGPLLVSTGRLHDQKDHLTLLEALAKLPADTTLVIAGTGKREPRIRERAAVLGVLDRLRLPGHVDDVGDLLSAADLFVLSSRDEGMPHSVLEAMAAGLPVVATAVGDVPLMLQDGTSGVLVPPGDPKALAEAATRVLADPPLARRLGEASRTRVTERYTEDRMVEGCLKSLRKAVAHRR